MLSTRPEFNIFDRNAKYTTVSYKSKIKSVIMDAQTSRSDLEWEPNNFIIHNIPGLRKSLRNAVVL